MRFRTGGPLAVAELDQCRALYEYDSVSRSLVLSGKNFGRRDLLREAARSMAAEVDRAFGVDFDAVSFVPATASHRRERGFDQGRVLARAVARSLDLPSRPLLRRRGASQKGRDREERFAGPEIRTRVARVPATILLIDDVITTGASLQAASRALRSAGAEHVSAITIAASVRPGDIHRAEGQGWQEQPALSGQSSHGESMVGGNLKRRKRHAA